jgi:hypothetical protein
MRVIFRAMARLNYSSHAETQSLSDRIQASDPNTVKIAKPNPPATVARDVAPRQEFIGYNYLPPEAETERLIQSYFSSTGTFFPYIHAQSFMETYRQMKQHGFRVTIRRSWLALLNMILAMATACEQGQHSAETQPTAKSDVYFERAQALCREQIFHSTTFETGKSRRSI